VLLYAYVQIANPFPDSTGDWSSVSIGHGIISIAHSRQPSRENNRPGMIIYPEDGGGNLHLTVEKSDMEDMRGSYLIILNQNMPYQLNFSFAFDDKDKITNEAHFAAYGIKFSSGTHSARMLGCADDDRTSLVVFTGYGIIFSKISHTVDKFHNWWTFMISLWYPVIIFSILPAVWVVQKLRGTKPVTQVELARQP
jgi:hypothetical protein